MVRVGAGFLGGALILMVDRAALFGRLSAAASQHGSANTTNDIVAAASDAAEDSVLAISRAPIR
jgi:hypothetical protein